MRKHIPALMSEQKHNAHLQSKDDTSPNTPRPVEEETGEQHRSRLTAHTMQRLPPRAISHTLRSPRPWHRCQLELQSVHRHARTAAGVHVYAGLLCSAAGWLEARVPASARYRRYGQDAERRRSVPDLAIPRVWRAACASHRSRNLVAKIEPDHDSRCPAACVFPPAPLQGDLTLREREAGSPPARPNHTGPLLSPRWTWRHSPAPLLRLARLPANPKTK